MRWRLGVEGSEVVVFSWSCEGLLGASSSVDRRRFLDAGCCVRGLVVSSFAQGARGGVCGRARGLEWTLGFFVVSAIGLARRGCGRGRAVVEVEEGRVSAMRDWRERHAL